MVIKHHSKASRWLHLTCSVRHPKNMRYIFLLMSAWLQSRARVASASSSASGSVQGCLPGPSAVAEWGCRRSDSPALWHTVDTYQSGVYVHAFSLKLTLWCLLMVFFLLVSLGGETTFHWGHQSQHWWRPCHGPAANHFRPSGEVWTDTRWEVHGG